VDFFTHMLVGYMLGWMAVWGFNDYNEYLILLSVIMAMIPDFDVFLYAIPRRFRDKVRGIHHRGITHTVLFVFGLSIFMSCLFHVFFNTEIVMGIFIAFVGGLSHVVADLMTSYAVPHLAPFSWKSRSLDIDGAITWYMIPYSLACIIAMWQFRVHLIEIKYFSILVTFVFLGIGIHYLIRLSVKYYVERVLFKGQGVKLIPNVFLLSFYVRRTRHIDGVNVREYIFTRVRKSKKTDERRYYEVDGFPASHPVLQTPKDVYEAVLSSSSALASNGFKDLENTSAIPTESSNGTWEIFWFDWHRWNPMRETTGIKVKLSPGIAMSVTSASMKVRW
jgi:membrane-bound metal-dependent hydrolase YbcI (DUF457 family)